MKPQDVLKALAVEWKALPESEKRAAKEKTAAEADSYTKAVKAWREAHPHQNVNRVPPSMESIRADLKSRNLKRQEAAKQANKKKGTRKTKPKTA
jgi:hypothetical protein